ncbi:hypothetical protein [Pseudomonas gessardii]|uniref:Uncharacterized protein n=1 Tax=Pseudomonas gessardii TaxID=78544 RepID=A0A7Y1QPU2_9PSED|nr:hypothetical protein [Pseudomonas gessardii]NNA99319.1 hypothetical protein [Pseudomonas gessardii]
MTEVFKREERYIVIKHSDISGFWREDVREQFFAALERLNEHHVRIPQRQFLVIESDWPEYEPAWQMIEDRVAGRPSTASAFRALLAERNALAFLLKRFVDGEHDQEENQAERHMYHDEAQTLLAYLGGQVQGYTLVPDDALRALTAERDALRKGLTEVFNHIECNTECLVRDLVNWGTPRINPNDFYTECEAIKAIASAALNADAATQSTDTENVSRHEGGQT